jgi:hypothetical protein
MCAAAMAAKACDGSSALPPKKKGKKIMILN